MAKIKYNVKGVDRSERNYEQPQPGLYTMEIKEANHRDKDGKNDIELILEITEDNELYVGSRVWSYVGLGDASQWKLAELTDALDLPETGTLDTTKLVGKKMKVKVNSDSWNNEYRARAGRFAPLEGGDVPEASADDDPDAAGGGSDGGDPDAAATAASDDGDIVVERNDVELSSNPDYYADWSDGDVFEEVDNQKISLGRKKKSRANVIAALTQLVIDENSPDGEAEVEPEADGDTYDDTDEWSDAAIAAEVKKRGLEVKGKRNRTTFIAALREADSSNEQDDPFAE